ncbi:MAG: error-prone DNA polymerase [Thermoguttaceae bacterium]
MQYAELHAKTNFSFLEGASHPDELVYRARELGYPALAITDRNSLAGIVRAHVAAKQAGVKLLVGAEITPADAPPVVLLAMDRGGYGRLCNLITGGRRRAAKGHCRLTFRDVADAAEGLIAAVREENSGVTGHRVHKAHKRYRISDAFGLASGRSGPLLTARALQEYRAVFGDRCYLLAELDRGPDDEARLDRLVGLARQARVPLVAGGDVYYHVPERRALCDILTAIRRRVPVAEAGEYLFANAQRCLKSAEEMAAIFARLPEAVARSVEVAERVRFSLDELRYEYPEELVPAGSTPSAYLRRLVWAGARKRYPGGVPEKVRGLIEHELRLIEELRYEAYFLTVFDLVRFARRRGILCQGRGSAANSAVCYCLGITSVDPDRMDVLFERFVSRERNEAPDIDVDFEHQRREEIIQYLYRKYGRDRAGMTAEVITYQARSAVRDVGKALGLSLDRVDALARKIEPAEDEGGAGRERIAGCIPAALADAGLTAERCREAGIDPDSMLGRQLVELVGQLVGFPRHLSQHTGGMVITRGPLRQLVPIENAAMPGRTVIQWNKDDLDELGILKVDCLALGMLTAIHRTFDLVARHGGPQLSLSTIPPEDPQVYAMIRRADTMGVFQIESRAQMSMLPRLKPRCFYDLVIEVAIVRPGPIQGEMVHPYLRRRNGEEPVSYPSPEIRQVLEKTLGVPLFQEQAMRLAVVAAGFTPGEADQLRRAMGAWRRPGLIDQFHKRLIEGMLARGLSQEYAEGVFRQIRGFGDYGFPESHAASFALLVYVSAWLKHHYQAAFTAGLLNSQPMGFYAPPQLVRDARRHGVEVRPVDVNFSDWDCTLEQSGRPEAESGHADAAPQQASVCCRPLSGAAVRLGLRMISGLSETHARRIAQARQAGPFRSLEEFVHRTGLGRPVVARLARAGAFGSLGLKRRKALWDALAQDPQRLPLFDSGKESPTGQAAATDGRTQAGEAGDSASGGRSQAGAGATPLPPMSPVEEVLADYRATGLSLRGHPMEFLRSGLEGLGVVPAERLERWPAGKPIRVAGIVLLRQRPATAKGITFVTLEDETGTANLIVRPDVWRKFRAAALEATILLAHGRLQREGQVVHVLVSRLEDLSGRMRDLASRSRDFC